MIDKLKIDQSFVKEIGQSADAIVRAMINLARSLNLQVTAEGVETVTQRERLAAIGCQELQGHSLSRPVSADDMMAMLSDGRPVTPTRGNPRPPRQLA